MSREREARLSGVLQEIVETRRRRVVESAETLLAVPSPDQDDGGLRTPANNAFLRALDAHRGRAIIAEIKLGSPRIGSLVDLVDPAEQAKIYADNGAAALSVVVEPDYFHGSYDLVGECREASGGLPAIAKDFVVDSVQLRWARMAGADAVLLIAALYEADELARLADTARSLGLVPLIETHSDEDVEHLAAAGALTHAALAHAALTQTPGGGRADAWELVGVNNRDLRTFHVDLEHSMDLARALPAGALKVAESGISGAPQIEQLQSAGFEAFLVGEALLLADDPATKLRELVG